MISLIVAHARNLVIGANGTMPWHLPADLRHFKDSTMGCPVIMGRRTFASIGRALPGRRNVVISSNQNLALPAGVELVNSFEAAIALLKDAPEIFVIGGGMLYKEALPLADRLYLTIIQAEIEGDTSFPAYDLNAYRVIAESFYPKDEKNAYDLRFVTLEKKSKF